MRIARMFAGDLYERTRSLTKRELWMRWMMSSAYSANVKHSYESCNPHEWNFNTSMQHIPRTFVRIAHFAWNSCLAGWFHHSAYSANFVRIAHCDIRFHSCEFRNASADVTHSLPDLDNSLRIFELPGSRFQSATKRKTCTKFSLWIVKTLCCESNIAVNVRDIQMGQSLQFETNETNEISASYFLTSSAKRGAETVNSKHLETCYPIQHGSERPVLCTEWVRIWYRVLIRSHSDGFSPRTRRRTSSERTFKTFDA